MAKNKKIFAILVVFCVVISTLTLGLVAINSNQSSYNSQIFKNDLTSIYTNYDGDYSNIDKNNKFALKRIILADYDGNDYNAVATAIDEKNNFAVLQYNDEQSAKLAYNSAVADGHIVDCDCVVTLDSYAKGEMYPLGSNTLGTSTYMKKYAMGYDDVTVAVIDTAFMLNHTDLKGRFLNSGYDYTTDNHSTADYGGCLDGDYYYHATFVSGIIANNTPDNVKILPYKVVADGANDSTASALLSAINDAIDRGVDVISLSISSTECGSLFKAAVNRAVENGICLCASAGNEGTRAYSYPAIISGTITVSALDENCKSYADYTCYGSTIDFSAPGTKVLSTIPTSSGSGYARGSGTSFSTPYIAACCANIKSINSDFSKDDVYNILCDFATDYGTKGRDNYFGNGVPNLANMVYTDGFDYSYSIPEGVLNVYNSDDYTKTSQPWALFGNKIVAVNIDSNVTQIGDFSFYNMSNANFNINSYFTSVGTYAFYGCSKLSSITFNQKISYIGDNAFGNLSDDFVINGYSNSSAERYALNENIKFNSLGCKHSYTIELVDPYEDSDGYTIYTCTACGYSYIGEYIQPDYTGVCGSDITWYYDMKTRKLTLSGSGAMDMYGSADEIPWSYYLKKIVSIEIEKDITMLSPYSFYDAVSVTSLTMPCSIKAPTDNTMWFNCSNIQNITLTLGNGKMGSFGTSLQQEIYTYTPWYISRDILQSLSIDADVKSIGAFAFRGCDVLKTIVLRSCEKIGDYAFYDCDNLTTFVNYNKTTTYGENSVFYNSNTTSAISGSLILCYNDSTAKDYAVQNDINYGTFGCTHSRGSYEYSSLPTCCYDTTIEQRCDDCDKTLSSQQSSAYTDGHYVKGTLVNENSEPIKNAKVYIDGTLSSKTNSNGKFLIENVMCGSNHTVEITKYNTVIATTTVNTDASNQYGTIKIVYGDYVKDGVVNAKDYAYAKSNGISDISLFNYGKVENEELEINTPYATQTLPYIKLAELENVDNSVKKRFSFKVDYTSEYEITECGFIYGKNMDDDFITFENVGKKNDSGYELKTKAVTFNYYGNAIEYGSSDGTGKVSARFYFTYTNGVVSYTVLSDVLVYNYDE